MIDVTKEASKKMSNNIGKSINIIGEKLTNLFNRIGEKLTNIFDKVKTVTTSWISSFNSDVTSMFDNMGQKIIEISSSAADKFKEFKENFSTTIGNWKKTIMTAGIAIIAVITTIAFKWWKQIQEAISEFRSTTGLVNKDFRYIEETSQKLAGNLAIYGISMKDVLETASELLSIYGSTSMISEKLLNDLTLYAQNWKLGTKETVKAFATYKELGNLSDQIAIDMIGQTISLANMGKVAPKAVMADIAAASESALFYMGGMPDVMMRTAVRAKQLGLDLNKVAEIADKILDLDTSMTAEMEAMVLTGKNLNLNRARMLAMEGDFSGMMDEVLDKVGTLKNFNDMEYFQKRAIAKLVGMEALELSRALQLQENIVDISAEKIAIEKKYSKTAQTSLDKLKYTWESVTTIIGSKFYPSIVKLMNDITKWLQKEKNIEKIRDIAKITFTIIKNIAKAVGWVLSSWVRLIAVVTAGALIRHFHGIHALIGGIGKGVASLSKGLVNLITKSKTLQKVTSTKTAAPPSTEILKKVQKVDWKVMGMQAVQILAFAGAIWILSDALKKLSSIPIKELIPGIIGLGAVMAGLILSMNMLSPAATLSLPVIGVMLALAGAVWILSDAMNKIIPPLTTFVDVVITKLSKGMVDILSTVFKGISDLANIGVTKLLGVASGIYAIGLSLMSLGAGTFIGGINSFFGNILGGNQFDKLIQLANVSDKLERVASSIEHIGRAVNSLNFSTDKLNQLNKIGKTFSKISPNLDVETKTLSKFKVSTDEENNKIINKLDQVIETLKTTVLTVKGHSHDIIMDGKKVSTALAKVYPNWSG